MRGVTTLFAVFALGGLAACNGEPLVINPVSFENSRSEHQTLCYENQIKAADFTLPSFERERARNIFNQKDCVFQSLDQPDTGGTQVVAAPLIQN